MRTMPMRAGGGDDVGVVAGLHADGAAVPLLGVEVRADVVAGHARALVRQRYRNDGKRAIEAIYTFPLPTRAALTGFSMTVEGRRLEGEVHEREEAFRRYDDAITAGHGGALLEQERPNVFTANVGNLLPGEETILEIEYVEPLTSDEGAVRWSLPTVVAPRYMPGVPGGDRSGHGAADPTSRVPDADRISPPIGSVRYGLSLELIVDLGQEVEVESPSHAIVAKDEGMRTRVTFVQDEVALDRDVVITAYPKKPATEAAPLATVVAHRSGTGPGTFALTLVPDLAGSLAKRGARTNVVFVLDRSGSMGGPSMQEARTALRLCLRQLREGDTFGVLAFDDTVEAFEHRMVPFTQATLQRADDWLQTIEARGGTELLAPMARAVELAPDGVIVLLTDGQVGNEDEIEQEVLAKRGSARIYSFGIGTTVSDTLLVALGDKSGGGVELIHPGERVDEKVIAQFARATAPRVTDLKVSFRNVDVGEIAPAEPVALVDGEPFTVFGTYEAEGRGAIEIRGTCDGEKLYLEVPIDLPAQAERPAVTKLWARARIADLEHAVVTGRRADAMRDRIVKLAKEHGVASRYTSFVVVEKRTGDRRVTGLADTHVVPVSPPAGWDMFKAKRTAPPMRMYAASMAKGAIGRPAPSLAAARPSRSSTTTGAAPPMRGVPAPPACAPPPAPRAYAAPPPPPSDYADAADEEYSVRTLARGVGLAQGGHGAMHEREEGGVTERPPVDAVLSVLSLQGANGLWELTGKSTLEATVDALVVLLREGVTAGHPVHGAQVKKGVEALLAAIEAIDPAATPKAEPRLVELALGVAWLLSTGRRTRAAIEAAVARRADLGTLRAALASEAQLRAHVDRLAC
jgi:Ca-activated chloride channel family protein